MEMLMADKQLLQMIYDHTSEAEGFMCNRPTETRLQYAIKSGPDDIYICRFLIFEIQPKVKQGFSFVNGFFLRN